METKNLMTLGVGLALMLMANISASGQNFEIPQKEFSLTFSTYRLELVPGDSSQLDIGVLKSKGYQKSKVKMGISSSMPKGVAITFQPANGNFDFTRAIVSVDDSAIPGTYPVVLNATVHNQTKGSILKLIIKE